MDKYSSSMYARLSPVTKWSGSRITDIDVLALDEAASFASKHAKTEITIKDFLRAASRGEIRLLAIVKQRAKVEKIGGGIYCTSKNDGENTIPMGSIQPLPIVACNQLANVGRANWREFDGFKAMRDTEEENGREKEGFGDEIVRYTIAKLTSEEPDFETVIEDCRVFGRDVHALADTYLYDDAWFDGVMDASFWWDLPSIQLEDAALLLMRLNPKETTVEEAERISTDETNPDDFKKLRIAFEALERVDSKIRTLADWLLYAKSSKLKIHSWIDEWKSFHETTIILREEQSSIEKLFKDDEAVPATSKLENGHQSISFENPHEPTQASTNIVNLTLDTNIVPVKSEPDSKPWNIKDERDPEPSHFQAWYTAARYFARILIRDDPSLLQKTEQLVKKIQSDLLKINITKRGGKKPPATATIKKALQNIKFN